jgi:methylmalonyl-CoA mutase N-terminal domain/subunit
MEETSSVPLHVANPEREREQIESLEAIRQKRNTTMVSASLQQLEAAARTDDNLMPYILNAVQSYASVGEISNVFRKVHGEFREALLI